MSYLSQRVYFVCVTFGISQQTIISYMELLYCHHFTIWQLNFEYAAMSSDPNTISAAEIFCGFNDAVICYLPIETPYSKQFSSCFSSSHFASCMCSPNKKRTYHKSREKEASQDCRGLYYFSTHRM